MSSSSSLLRSMLVTGALLAACAGPHATGGGNVVPEALHPAHATPDSLPAIVEVATMPAAPYGIAPDLLGNEWMAGESPSMMMSIAESNHAKSHYDLPDSTSNPSAVALGPNHNGMWFTESAADAIGYIQVSTHAIHEFPLAQGAAPVGIAAGPDNAMWFTEAFHSKIGRISMSHFSITEFSVPGPVDPYSIALGADGNLWFTEYLSNKIGHITIGGQITQFPLPHPSSRPLGITEGPDGALWFTEENDNHGRIGRINPQTHAISEWTVPSQKSHPGFIVARHNELWFTEITGNRIGSIDATTHAMTEYDVPTAKSSPWGIALGEDAQLWFTQKDSKQVGKLCPGQSPQQCAMQ